MPADLIIYALITAGLIFWLRSILGTKHGEERERNVAFLHGDPEEHSQKTGGENAIALIEELIENEKAIWLLPADLLHLG